MTRKTCRIPCITSLSRQNAGDKRLTKYVLPCKCTKIELRGLLTRLSPLHQRQQGHCCRLHVSCRIAVIVRARWRVEVNAVTFNRLQSNFPSFSQCLQKTLWCTRLHWHYIKVISVNRGSHHSRPCRLPRGRAKRCLGPQTVHSGRS
jgi:hypothetical protein